MAGNGEEPDERAGRPTRTRAQDSRRRLPSSVAAKNRDLGIDERMYHDPEFFGFLPE
eukprot:CAMPEP_0171521068 /NCGR_PEP_ID=MMETSP0959-20130129/6908_1 /TAXON_ID=87120 /ORGANISM="Aurantiochytrium limacinum, Strain ATCCMYA-1381" /LENGTH=56 /DNA_ID=CAMNT_0012060891 /DNA_START=348 /DNA_END=518 /DNA_ORIENTATION=-